MTLDPDHPGEADGEARALGDMGALPSLPKRGGPVLAPVSGGDFGSGIAARFRQVAAACPHNIAIWKTGRQVTYGELDRVSDALASTLIRRGMIGSRPVALGTEDAIGYVCGFLAILKAGGFYLPVSHQLPAERRNAILKQVSPDAAIATTEAEASYLGAIGRLERSDGAALSGGAQVDVASWPAPSEAAYVLFTSGSTGTPKGVVQSQKNLLRNTSWQTDALSIDCSDRFSQLHADGTMGAVRATLNALLNGATLCPFDISATDLTSFGEWIRLAQPTVLHSAASFFRVFAKALSGERQFNSVRLMILGGEAVTGDDFQLFRKRLPATSYLCTGLGSTETTTVRMMCLPPQAEPVLLGGRLPLGFPVPGTRIRLADSAPDETSAGTIGEMELECPTLFPGYWPLDNAAPAGERRFRMGDLALRTAEGVLYHMGRKDHQVKVNSNRVDLLEIERAVSGIHGVREACVIAETVHGSNAKLLLFVHRDDPTALTTEKIRYFLRRWFPPYMRPGSIFLRDSLPRIAGGKIDIGQLRQSAQQETGADTLDDLRQGRTGADAELLECFIDTSYPFLRHFFSDAGDKNAFDEIELRALPFDSLSTLEICLNIEMRFGVRIDPDKLASFRRYRDLLKALTGE